MKKLFLLPSAQADMDSIWVYTAEYWDFNQADRYIDDIVGAYEALADGRRQAQKFEPRAGYFRYAVGSHVIYFHDDGDTMKIVRILHGSMDAPRHL
jgi:toxin ParE1/3/4